MKKLLVLATSILLLGAGGGVSQDTPAAVVVKVEGSVQLAIGGGDPQAATVGTRLGVGDRILPSANGRAIVVYQTGATRTVTEAVTIEAASAQGDGDMFSRTVEVLSQAASSDARNQPNRQGMIRPVPGYPEIISPRNRIPVMAVRPTFQWHPTEGAEGYRIQIRKDGGAPVRYEAGAATLWTLPESTPALERGATYWWTVGPTGRGRPSREMQFQVLSEEDFQAVEGQLQALREAGLDPSGDGAFMSAVVYREAGLLYDAAHALDYLEEIREPMGVEAWLLKGEVLDALGDLEGAQAAFDQADRLVR